MSEHEQEVARREHLKQKARAWDKRFEKALEICLQNPDIREADVIDTVWQANVDRLSPNDPEEKAARIELGKDVWKGERTDPELPLRIEYAIAQIEESIKRNWSAASAGWFIGGQAVYPIMGSEKTSPLHKLFGMEEHPEKVQEAFLHRMKEKAKEECRALGGTPHESVIPFGAEGMYKEIPVVVDRYSSNGTIVLKAKNFEDHMRLFDATPKDLGGSVSPSELDPADFKKETPDAFDQTFEMKGGRASYTGQRDIAQALEKQNVRESYENDWANELYNATKSYEGKTIRVRVQFKKTTNTITFSVES